MDEMERSPRVVIVGAGIAAVAAANLLISEGIEDVVMLEATDRIGGRIFSVELGTAAVTAPVFCIILVLVLVVDERDSFSAIDAHIFPCLVQTVLEDVD